MKKPLIAIAANLEYLEKNDKLTLNRAYFDAVAKAGGLPLVVPPTDELSDMERFMSLTSGLLLPGGVDIDPLIFGREPDPGLGEVKPELDRFHIAMARIAMKKAMPILGICRGAQVMNVAAGGNLIQDIEQEKGSVKHLQNGRRFDPSHTVETVPGSLICSLLGERIIVNSFHHQAIDGAGKGISVTARAKDGIVEAIEMAGNPFALGVQWHPEAMMEGSDRSMEPIFREFVAACANYGNN